MTLKRWTRRDFAQQAVLAPGLGGLFLGLPAVSAQEAQVNSDEVQYQGGIEPTVRLIEETPRDALIEVLAGRIQKGLSYREVLAGLLLAGVRNVQPRPSVGFKFHCVLVINSCHLASLSGPDEDRWLPILWAADYFKSSQEAEARQSGWKMGPVNESLVPAGNQAREMFIQAMENWDEEKADAATAGLCRSAGATEIFNLFARFAARDYRSIGHKAIYLANAWRTLQVIGWNFAEPVMRSLAFALLNHQGDPNPAQSDLAVDRPWRSHEPRLERIPANWLTGKQDDTIPRELIQSFREGAPDDPAALATEALVKGVSPQSIWDGVFLGAGELLMRQPGIIGLHGLTTANAMYYLWKHADDGKLRQRLLLQACSFNPMFRESAKSRGTLHDRSLESLMAAKQEISQQNAIEEILTDISRDRMRAAEKLRSYLNQGGSSHEFVDQSRRVLFQKGRDAHDYKFSSAVLEDYAHISPAWRDEFLAMSVFNLKGTGHTDNRLNQQIRELL